MTSGVIIVEDDLTIQAHISAGISAHPALDLLATAASLSAAWSLIDASVALFIVDLGLPDGSGLALIREIRERLGEEPRVLVLSVMADRTTVMAAILAGADGYLLKSEDSGDIGRQAADVLDGRVPLSPGVATYVLSHLREQRDSFRCEAEGVHDPGLTPREIELLQLLARGCSNKQAAAELSLSPHTVGEYVKSIYRKLRVRTRGEAMVRAGRRGLLRS